MRRETWESRGLDYAGELAARNLADLHEILRWNAAHDIYRRNTASASGLDPEVVHFYRCTSDLVPWNSQFDLEALPNYDRVAALAADCGSVVREHGMRPTFHPDHWCKLASETESTVENSLTAVEYHADWVDLLGLDGSPSYGINVHIGATYGDKAATAERFRDAIARLSPGARQRLTVENDDKASLWSVPKLVDAVGDVVPVVFDYHHHQFTDRGLTYRAAFELARSTWGDVRPAAHYSEPARLYGVDARPQAHADVMLEAGEKERALRAVRGRTD